MSPDRLGFHTLVLPGEELSGKTSANQDTKIPGPAILANCWDWGLGEVRVYVIPPNYFTAEDPVLELKQKPGLVKHILQQDPKVLHECTIKLSKKLPEFQPPRG